MSSFLRRTVVALTVGAVVMPFAVLAGPVAATAAPLPVIGNPATLLAHPATYVRPLAVLGSGSQGFLYASTTEGGLAGPEVYYRTFGGAKVSLGLVPGSYLSGSDGQPSLNGTVAYVPVFDGNGYLVSVRSVNVAAAPATTTIATIIVPEGFDYVGPAPTGIYISAADDDSDVVQVYPWTQAQGATYANAVVDEGWDSDIPYPDPVGLSLPAKFTAGSGIDAVQAHGGKLLITHETDDAHTSDGNYGHLALVSTTGAVTPLVHTPDLEQIVHANLGPSGVVVGVVGDEAGGSADRVRVFWANGDPFQSIDLQRDLADVRLALTPSRLVWADGESTTLTSQAVLTAAPTLSLGVRSTGPLAATVSGTVLTYVTPDTRYLSIRAVNPVNPGPQPVMCLLSPGCEPIPFQPADTFGLDVSAGRIVSQEESVDPAAYATRTFTVTGGNAVGAADPATTYEPASYNSACWRLCSPVLTSASRTVRLVVDVDGIPQLKATNGTRTTLLREANADDVLLSLSGPDLVYRDTTAGGYVLTLLNVDTGVTRALKDSTANPISTATVRARVLYEAPIGNGGTIKTTDLVTGAVGSLYLDPTCDVDVQSAVGSWLLYSCSGGLATRVYSRVTQESVTLPANAEYRLGDGFVGLRTYTIVEGVAASTFKVLNLTDLAHGIFTVGNATEFSQAGTPSDWSVDNAGGQALAYETNGHDLKVVPVNVPTSPVELFTSTSPTTFTPDGDGRDDVWAPEVEVSKPATWSLTVLNSAGGLAHSQALPSATLGSFTWDGKTSGTLAADGAYQWTITATPADGVGSPVVKSGTVTLRAKPLAVTYKNLPVWFTPDGDGKNDSFAPVVTTSLPASWVFKVTTAAGVRVRTQTSGAVTTVRPTWDGRMDVTRTLQPDANYKWSLTLTDATGYGPAVALTGTVNLRARAVAVSARASTFSSDASTNGYSTISWSSGSLPPYATGYNVSYRTVAISSTGRRTYGSVRPWLRNTRAKSGRLYVPAGSIIQVLVTVVDSAPIKMLKPTAYATTASPIDDRSFSFSSGWSNKYSSSAYKRTLKYASVKGKTATRTVYGSSIRLIGLKCKKCGSLTVSVDGRKYTVSTYASSTRSRQTLFATTRSAGRHVIKVTVLGTRGRPGVWLDGVGARV